MTDELSPTGAETYERIHAACIAHIKGMDRRRATGGGGYRESPSHVSNGDQTALVYLRAISYFAAELKKMYSYE